MPYKKLCQALGYQFENQNLLIQALTRTSAFNVKPELRKNGDYQRLEFLGDKILGQIVSDVLFDHYPSWTPDELSSQVANFVNNSGPLAEVALSLGLDELLIMDQGEDRNNLIRTNIKALSDAMEALLGAVWIDSNRNYSLLRQIILAHWNPLGLLPFIHDVSEFECDHIIKGNKVYFLTNVEREKRRLLVMERPCAKHILNNALVTALFSEDAELVEKLLQKGADPNFVYPPENEQEASDWNYSGYGGYYDPYKGYSVSVLHIAVTHDQKPFPIIKLLLKYGADPNWNQGWMIECNRAFIARDMVESIFEELSELSECFEPKGISLVSLLEFSKSPESIESNRATSSSAFFHPAKSQKVEPKKILLQHTALHALVSWPFSINNIEKRVRLLLKAGADPTLRDFEGKTFVDIAKDGCSWDFEKILKCLALYSEMYAFEQCSTMPKQTMEHKF